MWPLFPLTFVSGVYVVFSWEIHARNCTEHVCQHIGHEQKA